MADRTARILIGVETDTQAAANEIASFSARMDALTAEFEHFGEVGAVVGQKIADGQELQASEIDALVEGYAELTTAVNEAFPEDAPEKLTSAMKIAKSQIAALADSVEQVPVELNKIEPAADKAERAIADIANEAKKLPDPLTRAEAAVQKFNDKLQLEADVSQGELENIWRSQLLLNEAIQRGEINLKEMGEEGVKRLKAVRSAANDAEQEFIRLERAVDQQAAKTKLASGDISGAGTAMFGTFSKVAGVAGIVIGLIVQFKDKLVDIASWLGLRGDKVQSWLDGISARAQIVLRSSFDTLKNLLDAGGTILDGITSKNVALIKQGFAELENASKKTLDGFTVGFSGTNEEVEKFAKGLGITTAAAERNKDAIAAATEEAKRLAEEKKRLSAEVDGVTRSLALETAELERQRGAATSNEMKAFDSSGQLKNAEGDVRRLEQAVDSLREKLAQQIDSWGADSAAVANTRQELGQYEAMLTQARARAEQLAESTARFRDEQEKATAAATSAEERVSALKDQQGKLTEELEKLTGATEKSAHGWTYAESQVVLYRDAQGHMEIGQKAVKVATEEATAAVVAATEKDKEATTAKEESKSATEKATEAVETMAAKMNAVKIDTLQAQVDKLNTSLVQLTTNAATAAQAIEKLSNAGGEAADDDGISIRRSGSATELGKGDRLGGGFKSATVQPPGF